MPKCPHPGCNSENFSHVFVESITRFVVCCEICQKIISVDPPLSSAEIANIKQKAAERKSKYGV
jgi:hypothetical protein